MKPAIPYLMVLFVSLMSSCKKNDGQVRAVKDSFFRHSSSGAFANDMVLDGENSIYITGTTKIASPGYSFNFDNAILKGNGNFDIFLIKYNEKGEQIWAKLLGGPRDDQAEVMAVDPAQNSYLLGRFRDSTNIGGTVLKTKKFAEPNDLDHFIAKYDRNGKQLWVKQISGEGWEEITTITVDPSGNTIYLAGSCHKSIFLNDVLYADAQANSFIACINPSGQTQWLKMLKGGCTFLKVATDGGLLIAGSFSGTYAFGSTTVKSAGEEDAFVGKLTSGGDPIWARSFGGTSSDMASAFAVDQEDNCYVAGRFRRSIVVGNNTLTSAGNNGDGFCVKYDRNGTLGWSTQMGSSEGGDINGLTVSNDNLYTCGRYGSSASFGGKSLTGGNGFFALLSKDGNFEYAENLGSYSCYPNRILVDKKGYWDIYGEFTGPITFNGTEFKSDGLETFLLRNNKFFGR